MTRRQAAMTACFEAMTACCAGMISLRFMMRLRRDDQKPRPSSARSAIMKAKPRS